MSTLETTGCSKPLAIQVTEAGRETLFLRSLLRQAVPLLRHPEESATSDRHELAGRIERAVGATAGDDVASPPFPDGSVPPETDCEPCREIQDDFLWMEYL